MTKFRGFGSIMKIMLFNALVHMRHHTCMWKDTHDCSQTTTITSFGLTCEHNKLGK